MKKVILFLTVLIIIIGGLIIWLAIFSGGGEYKKGEISLAGEKFRVEIAESVAQQSLGLGGRESIRKREGMLFVYSNPTRPTFWMKGMKFPIDIIWIKDSKVVGFEKEVRPEGFLKGEMFRPKEKVNMVLELQAGMVEELGIKEGEEVWYNQGI